jgi:5-methylcytosine-specific restriction enzyme subunit McrC
MSAHAPIPIANLLRIAFYAGDVLDELDDCEATHDDGASFDDVLQAMLARAAQRIRLRGFERGYTCDEEVTARPRGRMLIAESIATCAIQTGRLVCRFEEFGPDTPHNRVLKACARTLMRSDASTEHQESLRALVREMRDVADVKLSRPLLRALPRSLATRRYRVVRFVARLLIDAGQPDEQIGDEWARRLLQNEKAMRKVFERFVYRFAKSSSQLTTSVGRWPLSWGEHSQDLVGNLNTDLTIRGKDWTRIIECKYMRSATTRGQYGNDMFHPTHLRQIYAYLARTRDSSQANRAIDGVILFPAIDAAASQSIDLGGFPVRVIQLSLDQPWSALSKELMSVLFDR